jgi:hypothetical protein
MGAQTAVKVAIGVLVIGGTFAALWAVYRPSLPTTTPVEPRPRVPLLHDAYADVQQQGGCPDIDGWLAVNALAKPVLVPEQELTEREPRTQAP